MGVVSLDVEVRNQRDEAVQSGRDVWLVARRPEAA
jgi:acyl dehydratase